MFIPIRTDYRMARVPWVNYLLVATNVIVFVLSYFVARGRFAFRLDTFLLDPDHLRLYQFFTAIFLHAGLMHLAGNMLFLWVFGNAVNDRLGHLGYLAFYLAGGVLAGVGYVLLGGHGPVLGASGAISAVTGAYLVLLPRARVMLLLWYFFVTTFEVSSLYFLLFQFLFNLWMALSPSFTRMAESGVAYIAHCSGYVFGIAVTAALLAVKLLPRDPMDLLSLFQAAHRRSRYRRMARAGYDPFSVMPPPGAPSRQWVGPKPAEAAATETAASRESQLRRQIEEAWRRKNLPEAAAKYLQLIQLADGAVLPQDQQLDVANQLMSAEQYPAAADAYERFLKHYGNYEHIADIYLMLGLLYGRYLQQVDQAERMLHRATETLTDERKLEWARADLEALRRRH
jgi:membrane associated rhomboid family serine protease